MGNSPSQKPFENPPSESESAAAGPSLLERVEFAVRSVATTIRSKCSVFTNLDFAGAFRIDEEELTTGDERDRTPESDTTLDDAGLPDRDQPFVRPVREEDGDNPPDLQFEEADDEDELSIYYPENSDATITSDTYERVDR